MNDTTDQVAQAPAQDTGGGLLGNDFSSMLGNITDSLANAYVSITSAKNASTAAPSGPSAIKAQNPNTPPGFFGSFPQTQANIQGNPASSIVQQLTGTGMGLLVLALLALFFLRKR